MATNTKQKIYSDIDLRFNKQPGSRDVSFSYDEQAVIRSVKNLLLTKPFERLFQPELSSQVDNLLFEPITALTGNLLKNEITRVITNWEPRAQIASLDVTAYPDQNGYQVSMFLYIGNQVQPTAISLILKRSR
jgi:phage baseplate assembly protein W